MSDFDKHSRLNKFEKRRKTTKAITILIIIAIVLLLILVSTFIFGEDKSEEKESEPTEVIVEEEDTEKPEEETTKPEDEDAEKENDDEDEDKDEDEDEDKEMETESVDPSDDNVSEAYEGNWKPVETEQEGSHTTDYSKGSVDRIEIKEAIVVATGLDPDDMVEWKVENGGDQKVLATVSDHDEADIYRVYLSWIDGEGWQIMKIEELIENDKR